MPNISAAEPFPHIVIDDFIDKDILRGLVGGMAGRFNGQEILRPAAGTAKV